MLVIGQLSLEQNKQPNSDLHTIYDGLVIQENIRAHLSKYKYDI